MSRKRDERVRILGPTWLESMQYYRVLTVTPRPYPEKSKRDARYFNSQKDADDYVEDLTKLLPKLNTNTIEQAISGFEQYLIEKGTKGYQETVRRLRQFFPKPATPIARLTPEQALSLYDSFRKRKRLVRAAGGKHQETDEPISVAYHRSTLINVRTFMNWCVDQKLIRSNPFTKVKGVGRRSKGKKQLTGDEIKRFYAYCMARAQGGDKTALALLMALLMALRSSDIARRVVRDVDLGGTVLIVGDGKSAKSNRPRKIPRVLQPLVRELAGDREPTSPLFHTPYTESGHHTHRWLQEAMVKVCEAAGVPYVTPHSLKGAAGTVLAVTGELADRIADHLSHESPSTTTDHYVKPGVLEDARLEQALGVILEGESNRVHKKDKK